MKFGNVYSQKAAKLGCKPFIIEWIFLIYAKENKPLLPFWDTLIASDIQISCYALDRHMKINFRYSTKPAI